MSVPSAASESEWIGAAARLSTASLNALECVGTCASIGALIERMFAKQGKTLVKQRLCPSDVRRGDRAAGHPPSTCVARTASSRER